MDEPARQPAPLFGSTPAPGGAGVAWVGTFDATHERALVGAHAHHDLELLYFVRGGGTHRLGGHAWQVRDGDAYLVAPGVVHDLAGLDPEARGWAVVFDADALRGTGGAESLLLWRASPLLRPFLAAEYDASVARLEVAPAERPRWEQRFESMRRELEQPAAGSVEALGAHLLLLLVDIGRGASGTDGGIDDRETVLVDLFEAVERRFADGVSASDVASELGFTVGHLSTLVRRRTGRTLGEWILERRMAEARRLLATTGLPVQQVAQRIGYGDAAYFSRRFRSRHGVSPSGWRGDEAADG